MKVALYDESKRQNMDVCAFICQRTNMQHCHNEALKKQTVHGSNKCLHAHLFVCVCVNALLRSTKHGLSLAPPPLYLLATTYLWHVWTKMQMLPLF